MMEALQGEGDDFGKDIIPSMIGKKLLTSSLTTSAK